MSVVELNGDNFQSTIDNNDFIMIDFYAPWCDPCIDFAPIFEDVSSNYKDIVFAKVDTAIERSLADKFDVKTIPTLMIFRNQIAIFNQVGAMPLSELTDIIDEAISIDMEKVRLRIN
jgi:thioredoxin 1